VVAQFIFILFHSTVHSTSSTEIYSSLKSKRYMEDINYSPEFHIHQALLKEMNNVIHNLNLSEILKDSLEVLSLTKSHLIHMCACLEVEASRISFSNSSLHTYHYVTSVNTFVNIFVLSNKYIYHVCNMKCLSGAVLSVSSCCIQQLCIMYVVLL